MNNQEEDDLKLPDNFKIGEAVEGDNGFLYVILEGIKQLRHNIFLNIESLNNELTINCQNLRNYNIDSSKIINDYQPSSSTHRKCNPEIEGKITCTNYYVKLHIIEKEKNTEGIYHHKIIDRLGSKSVKDGDYSDTNTIHILNKGDGYFAQIINRATTLSIEHKKRNRNEVNGIC